MSFTLPPLPYAYDALQPYMSKETLEYHHDKHHNAYVTTGNNLLKGTEFEGKSLEAVWHRATLDLLAAVALLDTGRFAGTIVSYRAGHTQDVRMAGLLCLKDLIVPHV